MNRMKKLGIHETQIIEKGRTEPVLKRQYDEEHGFKEQPDQPVEEARLEEIELRKMGLT